MGEETIRKEFEEWADSEGFQLSSYTDSDGTKYACDHTQTAWWSWRESARRADKRAREECERIALQYSQAYGQIDDAMAIARDIRATIKEDT